jgi:hypothetical protein
MQLELEYAIEDARRFIARVEPYRDVIKAEAITESDLKLIRRHSMDVTHAMKTLREAIEATPEPEEAGSESR